MDEGDSIKKGRAPTEKYLRRKEQIIDIASELINSNGARGLSLSQVAERLSLDNSSVSYYFKRKDDLAEACYARALDVLAQRVDIAAKEVRPEERARRFLGLHFDAYRNQGQEGEPVLVYLAEMRALEGEGLARLREQAQPITLKLASFFCDDAVRKPGPEEAVAAHLLLNSALWLDAWLFHLLPGDIDRAQERLWTILQSGIFPAGALCSETPFALEEDEAEGDLPLRFVHAATNLINAQGYRGAGVEAIAAQLGVTVGSFYHHLENKDELVSACCERSFQIMRVAFEQAASGAKEPHRRIARALISLLKFQFEAPSPLLRHSVYQALPLDIRSDLYERNNREIMHFTGLVSDGQAAGALPMTDPYIAGQVIAASINAAVDFEEWNERLELEAGVEVQHLYCGKIAYGLFWQK